MECAFKKWAMVSGVTGSRDSFSTKRTEKLVLLKDRSKSTFQPNQFEWRYSVYANFELKRKINWLAKVAKRNICFVIAGHQSELISHFTKKKTTKIMDKIFANKVGGPPCPAQLLSQQAFWSIPPRALAAASRKKNAFGPHQKSEPWKIGTIANLGEVPL